ncbi:MAG: hypothetical protein ACC707_01745 [Thiohalomonadales bacterium]
MEERGIGFLLQRLSIRLLWSLAILLLFSTSQVQADFSLSVTDTRGGAVASYKWLLEEDTTFSVTPQVQTKESLSNSLQGSYAPVVTTGESLNGLAVTVPTDPTKKYYITVTAFGNAAAVPALPDGTPAVPGIVGYAINGAAIKVSAIAPVIVEVEALPLPVALVSVLVFRDKFKVNGVADLPQEGPIKDPEFDPTQFTVQLYEAGGRYGVSGGLVSQDAFGNPLGSTYNPDGTLLNPGGGVGTLIPDAAGELTIYNLSPGKYGIQVVPPPGQGWQQTSTLEGGKTVDAWVLANEAPHFTEFGPPGPHVFMGFVQRTDKYADGSVVAGTNVISGTVVNNHMSRPPTVAFYQGNDFPACWVALQPFGLVSEAEYIQPCVNSTFNITGVPDGTYEFVVFDNNLNVLLATQIVKVGNLEPPGSGQLGNIAVFNWFARFEAKVYSDLNENALRDPGEQPIQEQAINIRFRDGTIYQSFPTDTTGEVPFDEVFPFFHWLVAEVDFTTLKATGVTYVVDGGGGTGSTTGNGTIPVDNDWFMPSRDKLNPQLQPILNSATGNFFSTTIQGPVLTMGMQTYLGQTNLMEFGKTNYQPGENGGISGIIYYAVTRAENNPELAAAEPWEPGIPRVPLALYRDTDPSIDFPNGGIIDGSVNGVAGIQFADVDYYPFGWATGGARGAEDIDRDDPNQLQLNPVFDYGDAVQIASTDSWDDNPPTNCVSSPVYVDHPGVVVDGINIEKTTDCYDGFRMFNQVREAVFDGGYAFSTAVMRDATGALILDAGTGLPAETNGLVVGSYIVQSYPPAGYKTIKEEDRNVDFGNSFVPADPPADPIVPQQLPPVCVGEPHLIPEFLSFQTDSTGTPLAGIAAPENAPYFVGLAPEQAVYRPLCDTKQVYLTQGKNAAADFFMFTDVPIAAHVTGVSLDDLSNEFDKANPNFGEKLGMKWIPVVFRDWTGREIAKTYTDEYGRYNALVPSTYTVNIASPSGVQPHMLQACINDGTPDLLTLDVDPNYRANYSTTCYAMQFMPGSTSYLDTPVVPIAAFAGPEQFPVDCEIPTLEPEIAKVDVPAGGVGPYVPLVTTVGTNLPSADAARTIVITSTGLLLVPNPEFTGNPGSPRKITRDYGFGGTQGSAMLGSTPLTIVTWSDATITAVIPLETPTGELTVTRSNGLSSRLGVTVTTKAQNVITVTPSGILTGGDIQAAISKGGLNGAGAPDGSLILIAPGEYFEMVIVDRPLKLQGWGARSTIINALRLPSKKLINWRKDVRALIESGAVTKAPGQKVNLTAGPTSPYAFQSDESPVILVMAKAGTWNANADSRIDGLTLKGADQGGALLVNGYAHNLSISNNRIAGNQGNFGGGIRFGNKLYTVDPNISLNQDVTVHHNHIVNNGGTGGSGGGISIHAGTNNYAVTENFICGNFTSGNGAGIGHQGLSKNGLIADNMIVFNQSFSQGLYPDGGGIYIAGIAPVKGLGEGSGSVSILRNHIEGNHAAAGFGGGIRLSNNNGLDIYPLGIYNPAKILIENNMIVGNVAGNAGGGIAMQDAVNVEITNNTIADNMSTSTTGKNFQNGTPTQSKGEDGAGIVSVLHNIAVQGVLDTALAAGEAAAAQKFSDPALVNNVIWKNRTYHWLAQTIPGPNPSPGLVPTAAPLYSDLNVQDPASRLSPMNGILTDATGYDISNTTGDPLFIRGFGNGNRDVTFAQVELTIPNTAPAIDEGGNFIDVRYGPLSLIRNYHLFSNSPAVNTGFDTMITDDIDGLLTRPIELVIDKGADEVDVPDSDGDGIKDDLDNCILASNPSQLDTNGDGFGNRCDADLNNSGLTLPVDFIDYAIFGSHYNTVVGDPSYNPDADFNGDGTVNFIDYSILGVLYNKPPGPSALVP